eukprot:TRINITY_DN65262_c0_g1_i1.p1 TRINITY_DN65262_c0_g1~~TRINITY_DN65262_c0_g1_i1.p1  ORF type:complete len:339 (+),score=171.37 TRINITY_DN65262_c0_g1_i1:52-1017(+)
MPLHADTTVRKITEEDLLAPVNHIANVPGKGFRDRLIDAFNVWLQVPEAPVASVKSIVSKLHTSSLVIDDIEDNSTLRRGVPVAHMIYGVPNSINSANYVYFLAMQEAQGLFGPGDDAKFRKVMEIFAKEMCMLHRGQGQDIVFRDNAVPPTEEEYLDMVKGKTAGLFRLGVGILQLFSSFEGEFNFLLSTMGAYFQILDDYLNLKSGIYHRKKTFCEDITEGKYSFPLIHSIKKWEERNDDRLHKILRKCTESVDLKQYAVKLMLETDSFEYTRTRLQELYNTMIAEITRLGENKPLLALLNKLHSETQQEGDQEEGFSF